MQNKGKTGLTWDQWVSPEKLTEFAADWVK